MSKRNMFQHVHKGSFLFLSVNISTFLYDSPNHCFSCCRIQEGKHASLSVSKGLLLHFNLKCLNCLSLFCLIGPGVASTFCTSPFTTVQVESHFIFFQLNFMYLWYWFLSCKIYPLQVAPNPPEFMSLSWKFDDFN